MASSFPTLFDFFSHESNSACTACGKSKRNITGVKQFNCFMLKFNQQSWWCLSCGFHLFFKLRFPMTILGDFIRSIVLLKIYGQNQPYLLQLAYCYILPGFAYYLPCGRALHRGIGLWDESGQNPLELQQLAYCYTLPGVAYYLPCGRALHRSIGLWDESGQTHYSCSN